MPQGRSYLDCWSRSHIIQDMSTDIDHLQQVGEKLFHHGDQCPVPQSRPNFLLSGGCWIGFFFRGPWTSQGLGGTGCDTGTHITAPPVCGMGSSSGPSFLYWSVITYSWTSVSKQMSQTHIKVLFALQTPIFQKKSPYYPPAVGVIPQMRHSWRSGVKMLPPLCSLQPPPPLLYSQNCTHGSVFRQSLA